MSITHISTLSQLDGILAKSQDKLSVIDFHATWCGPCHAIAPTFEALSKQYKNVNFLKCDVDAAKEVAGRYSVSAMPTFIFLKGKSQVDMVRGANKAALESGLQKYSGGSSASAFSGKGQTLAGGASKASSANPTPRANLGTGSGFNNLSPQTKTFIYLLAGYALFWYLSG